MTQCGAFVAAVLAPHVAGQTGMADGTGSADGTGVLEDESVDDTVEVLRVIELSLLAGLGFLVAVGLGWHFATFHSWINKGLEYGTIAPSSLRNISPLCSFIDSPTRWGAAEQGMDVTITKGSNGIVMSLGAGQGLVSGLTDTIADQVAATPHNIAGGVKKLADVGGDIMARSTDSVSSALSDEFESTEDGSVSLNGSTKNVRLPSLPSPRDGLVENGFKNGVDGATHLTMAATKGVGTAVRAAGDGMNSALASSGSAMKHIQTAASDGLSQASAGRQRIMQSSGVASNVVVDTVLQKELVRKMGRGVGHKVHKAADNLVQTANSLPPRWRAIWALGTVVIVIVGMTILIMIPFSFTILLMLWTGLIVRIAAEPQEESELMTQVSAFTKDPGRVSNPMYGEEESDESDDESGAED